VKLNAQKVRGICNKTVPQFVYKYNDGIADTFFLQINSRFSEVTLN